jgi:hypothetical protein
VLLTPRGVGAETAGGGIEPLLASLGVKLHRESAGESLACNLHVVSHPKYLYKNKTEPINRLCLFLRRVDKKDAYFKHPKNEMS